METEYRQFRGEGWWLLKADWTDRRTKWNKFLGQLRKHKADKAQPDEKAATEKAVPTEPAQADELPLVVFSEPVAPGSKQDETGTWGCGRCRGSKTGCLSCNPAKAMKWSQKAKARGE